jgi:hypothetical protein
VIPAIRAGRSWSEADPHTKNARPYLKNNYSKKAGDMA